MDEHLYALLFDPLPPCLDWKAVNPLWHTVPPVTSRVCSKRTQLSGLQLYLTVKNLSGNTNFCTTIHLLTLYPLIGGTGGIRQRQGKSWPVNSSLWGYHIVDTNNHSPLRLTESSIALFLKCLTLNCERKLGHLERPCADTGRTCKLNREKPRGTRN